MLPLTSRAGTLSATFNSIPQGTVVDLTAEGTADWAHWGLFTESSIDRKVNVTPRISTFTAVDASNGYAYIYQYSGDYAGYSWSDGTPHMAVTNTTTGVWAYGYPPPPIGTGFRFTVDASTNLQTLKVYAGVFAGMGRFIAYLSDSGRGYTNESLSNISNGPSGAYTIDFAADSANQTLTVIYTLAQASPGPNLNSANVTLQSAALSAPGMNNLPFAALTSPPDGASFTPGDITLSANAGDADGTISLVEFYAGTNKVGEASAAPYSLVWTNPAPGSYALSAHAIDNEGGVGISSPAYIFVGGSGGSLSGARSDAPSSVDLTAEGTSDWAHWGSFTASSFDYKATGNSQISNFTLIGTNPVVRYDENFTAFTWSDGTPLVATNGSTTGVYVTGVTNGFEISAPADTTMRTLKVYVSVYGAQAKFEAFLSDFSAQAYTDTSVSNVFGNRYVVYTIDYAAASPGKLIVRQTVANVYDFTFGNVTLQAATLQGTAPPVTNLAPVVSIINPIDSTFFVAPATVSIEASASDNDGSVSQVEFFEGGNKLGEVTSAPFSFTWTNVTAGSYSLTARATDNNGGTATSVPVNISVTNSPSIATTIVDANILAGVFQFSFATDIGRNYLVQRTAVVPSTNWQTFTNVTGTGSNAVVYDSATEPQRFYRVETE